jgi:hypothetical protein
MPDFLIAGDFYLDPAHVGAGPAKTFLSERLIECIRSHRYAIVNFEAALGDGHRPAAKSGPNLSMTKESSDVLLDTGFNIVTLGNNHTMDFGSGGLQATLDHFRNRDVATIGAGACAESASAPLSLHCEGKSILIFNFCHNEWGIAKKSTPGVNGLNLAHNLSAVRKARFEADILIVITHMGHEYTRFQTPMVKSSLEAFAEAGADLVINHHPHVVGGRIEHESSVIFSSIGNFFFSSSLNTGPADTRSGLMVSISISESASPSVELIPVRWDPEAELLDILTGVARDEWVARFEETSAVFADPLRTRRCLNDLVFARRREYSGRLEPRNSLVFRALRKLGIFDSFWSRARKYALLNVIRCETHREILIHMLEEELRDVEE